MELPLNKMEYNNSETSETKMQFSSNLKSSGDDTITQNEAELALDSIFLENEGKKTDLKTSKAAIKRRRSSFGKYLTNNSDPSDNLKEESKCLTNTGYGTENNHSSEQCSRTADNIVAKENSLKENENIPAQTQTTTQKILSAKVKAYQEKLADLENEYRKWKRNLKQQQQRIHECKRGLREAQKGETVIEEEEVLPHLNKEKRAILSTRPDYGRYLQQIKFAREKRSLTQMEIQKVSLAYKSRLESAKSLSKASYNICEESILGDTKRRNTKHLMKEMLIANQY